jgi:DUF1016 N-terminal domain
VTPELRKHLALPAIGSPDPIREPVTPESRFSGNELITKLSFTHIAELLAIQDTLKRSFYETECIRGNWGVRELKRQIASLYFQGGPVSTKRRSWLRKHNPFESIGIRESIDNPEPNSLESVLSGSSCISPTPNHAREGRVRTRLLPGGKRPASAGAGTACGQA